MIPAERKALLFLATLGLLGAGARVVGGAPDGADARPGTERGAALDAQLAAVDSAVARERERTRAREPGRSARARRPPAGQRRDDPGHPVRDLPRARASVSGGPRDGPLDGWFDGPVDVDVADTRSLEALPGIGPALARRIVDDRAQRGAFGSLEALGRVRGVGPRLLARLSPLVTFSGTPRPP